MFGNRVDVISESQGDQVGLQAIDHRSRLGSGTSVRLIDGHGFSGLAFPGGGKRGVEILVELTRGIVRDIQKRRVSGGRFAEHE